MAPGAILKKPESMPPDLRRSQLKREVADDCEKQLHEVTGLSERGLCHTLRGTTGYFETG